MTMTKDSKDQRYAIEFFDPKDFDFEEGMHGAPNEDSTKPLTIQEFKKEAAKKVQDNLEKLNQKKKSKGKERVANF